MFKVIKAEIKKMVSKPGIFVLAGFLAIILVLGVFLYDPTVREYDTIPETLEVSVDSFANSGYKEQADRYISTATASVSSYLLNDVDYQVIMYGEDGESGLWGQYQQVCQDMEVRANNPSTTSGELQNLVNNFVDVVTEINTVIQSATHPGEDEALALIGLTSQSNYSSYTETYNIMVVNTSGPDSIFGREDENYSLQDRVHKYQNEYQSRYESCVTSITFTTLANSVINTYTVDEEGTRLHTINTRLAEIYAKIQEVEQEYSTTPSDELEDRYNELANSYRDNAIVYYNLVKYELMSNAFSFVSTTDSLNLLNLTNESEYNSNTQLIRYRYLFTNGKVDNDYANPLAVGSTIVDKTTAYDYTFFILKLFSFIIIAYTIMNACGSIAGEIKDGTMRYYAIRHIRRSDILFGKFLAILIMSFIMIVFSSIIAMCVGAGVYGWTNVSILTIFNGTSAMVVHPLVMILIFVLSFVIEVAVYASIAMLLSCLLKSDLLASTLMLLVYLLNIILPVFAGGMNSWLAFYPFSHINLFALFGSSIVTTGNDMLSMLLKVNIFANTSLLLSVCIIAVLIIIPIIISSIIFRRKEL